MDGVPTLGTLVEVAQVLVLAGVLAFLVHRSRQEGVSGEAGWNWILGGIWTFLVWAILDLLDNVPPVATDPTWQVVDAIVVDLLPAVGTLALAVGLAYWIPYPARLEELTGELEGRVEERTAEVAESEARLRAIAENVDAAVWLAEMGADSHDEAKVTYVGPGYEDLFGQPLEELEEAPFSAWLDRVHPEDREAVRRELEAVTPSDPGFEIEYRVERPDGEVRWLRTEGFPVDRGEGEPQLLGGITQDVTDRRERERGLEDERRYMDRVLDAFPDVAYVLGPDGYLRRWNDSLPGVTGYPDDEIGSMHATDFFPGEEQPRIAEAIEETFETGRTRIEASFLTVDGETIPYEFHSSTTTAPDGETVLVGLGRDISARRERERQLERYEQIVEHLPEGVYRASLGEERRFLDANPAAAAILGAADPSDLEGRSVAPFYPDEEAMRRFGDRLREEGRVRALRVPIRRLDGEERLVEVTAVVLERADGPDEYVGVFEDVTEEEARRRELEELRRQYESIIENIRDSLWLVDVGGDDLRVKRFNPALEAVSNRSPGEVQGMLLEEAFAGTPAHDFVAQPPDRYRDCIERGETVTFEVGVEVGGEERLLEIRLTPVVEGGEVHEIVGSARDVTEARRHEERLERERDQLEILNRLVRHDIKNDMTAVVGLTETLLDDVPDDVRDDLLRVRDTGQHVVNLTETVRGLVEVIREGGEVTVEPTPLWDVLEDEVRHAGRVYPDAHVELLGEIPDVDVRAGPLLSSVLRNLLNNAVLHNEKEEPTVEVEARRDGDEVTIRVADDGPGMPDHAARRLEGGEPADLDEEAGGSMGLHLVRQLVGSYGGTIEVGDRDPHGTVVTVRLDVVGGG